jgi:tetratricopeptide (TPR) repeat protein
VACSAPAATPDLAKTQETGSPFPEVRRLLDAPYEPGNLPRAIDLLEAARKQQQSPEIEAMLAEAFYFQAHQTTDRDAAVQAYDKAIGHGDRALTLVPTHMAARYWRAMGFLGKAGRVRGVESMAWVRQAVRELDVVVAADPALDAAGAHRALGKIYLDSPMWFMGDTDKAIEHLEAARRIAPDSLLNRRFLAQAYIEDGREADALRELERILNTPLRPGREASDQKEHDLARRMADRVRARLQKP